MTQDQDEDDLAWNKGLPCEHSQFYVAPGSTVVMVLHKLGIEPEKVHVEVFLGERLIQPMDWTRLRFKGGDVLNVHLTPNRTTEEMVL